MELTAKKCVPCEGGIPAIEGAAIQEYNNQLKKPWEVVEDKKIKRKFGFNNFVETMAFVNQVADLAETEGHHPDLFVTYASCTVELWTHAINGLSENDFILAAKVDEIQGS